MSSHLESFVRVSLGIALALAAMPLMRGRSAVGRRLVLTVAFATALIAPLLPQWHVEAPAVHALAGRLAFDRAAAVAASPAVAVAVVSTERAVDWLAVLWGLGALAVATRFAVGHVLARRIVQRSASAGVEWRTAIAEAERRTWQRANVRVSREVHAPAVTGFFEPIVLVPEHSAAWTEERRVAVLLHELAHVSAHDLGVQGLVSIVCSLHWFNPLVWLAARRLRLERELAADEAVLAAGVRASSYAEDLLAVAGPAPSGAIAIGERPLPTRIRAIVSANRPALLGRGRAIAVTVGTAAVAFGVACAKPSASTATVRSASVSDSDMQAFATRELEAAVHQWNAAGGTILVMTPKGEVLADVGGHSDSPYVAGSTMKTFLLAAALEEGRVSEGDVFTGKSPYAEIHDSSPFERAALPEAVARSSNVAFAQIFDRVGGAKLDRTLRAFHFTPPNDLSTEPPGDRNGALTAIGVSATTTPRQLTLAYAALADGGDGAVSSKTAARVTALLEGVVTSEHGTGTLAAVAGQRVAGKTGTSDYTDGANKTYASFVGYVPADKPRFVVFVGIDSPAVEGAYGGSAAAPVFSRIATHALAR